MNKEQIPSRSGFLAGELVLEADSGLTLVPYSWERADEFHQVLGHRELWYPWYAEGSVIDHDRPEKTIEHMDRAFKGLEDGTWLPWMILKDEELVGAMSAVDILLKHYRAKIGFGIIAHEYQSQGVATSAARAIIRWSFDKRNGAGLNRLEVDVAEANERSRKVCEAVGFKNEGVRVKHMLCADGVFRNMVNYGLTRDQYFGSAA